LEAVEGLATIGGLSAQILDHMRDAGTMITLSEGLDGIKNRLGDN